MSQTPIRLFVYGTLKRGQANHARFCANATAIVPAVIWGRLYHLDAGYPALEVPLCHILAHGTDDPQADAATQAAWPEVRFNQSDGNWDLIEGELMTFPDPLRDLSSIDRLEGFRPTGHSLYRRVLVTAKCSPIAVPVWTYNGISLIDRGTRVQIWPTDTPGRKSRQRQQDLGKVTATAGTAIL